MDKRFGLKFLLRTHLGIASNVVQPHLREERKSIGAERLVEWPPARIQCTEPASRTFSPLGDKEKILQKLQEIALELEKDMSRDGWTGRTVTLKYKLDTYQGTCFVHYYSWALVTFYSPSFEVFTRAKTFDRWVFTKEELYAVSLVHVRSIVTTNRKEDWERIDPSWTPSKVETHWAPIN